MKVTSGFRTMIIKQSFDVEKTLLHNHNLIELSVHSPQISVYDEAIVGEK